MMPDPNDKPKIIVDSDWKAEAQREKEQIERELQEEGPGELPPPSLLEIVQMVVMQASVALGGYQDPRGGHIPPNMALAKHYIDLLDLFHQKTAGNLDPHEKSILEATLHELRLAFVQQVSGGGGEQSAPPAPENA